MKQQDIGLMIGLEVHCQLTSLKTKLFCSCSSDYRGMEPNLCICEVCMGLPGSLPVLNKKAIESAVKIGLALNCHISSITNFFRKNYFYPDLPKNFQITQYDKAGGIPVAKQGTLETDDGPVRIRRIQIEEDPGKLNYEGSIISSPYALVDYNRAGIALTEIVTEPDIKSPRHAREFLNKLRSILEHIGVCDGGLDGTMRADANVSLYGGQRVEIKNISSFREVERGLNFEITRQKTLPSGDRMETRHWDDVRRVTVTLRVKEGEEDYRYLPEPDLMPVSIPIEFIETIQKGMPELPDERRGRFVSKLGLSDEIAKAITNEKIIADFFEETIRAHGNTKIIGGWIAGDIQGYLNREGLEFNDLRISAQDLVEISNALTSGRINDAIAKSVLMKTIQTGESPSTYLGDEISTIMDEKTVRDSIGVIFEKNVTAVSDALQDPKTINFLIGQVMKETRGRADHELARKIIMEKLMAKSRGEE